MPAEEIRAAEEKFESSKAICYNAMLTLAEGEVSCPFVERHLSNRLDFYRKEVCAPLLMS